MSKIVSLVRTTGWLLLIGLAACAVQEQQQLEDLQVALMRYEKAIRWGEFELANSMRDADLRAALPEQGNYGKIKVTSYRVIQLPAPNPMGLLEQVVAIGYVNNTSQLERTVKDRQLWRYDEETRRWWLVSDLPMFE